MMVIVGMRIEAQDLESQVGIGYESHCFLRQTTVEEYFGTRQWQKHNKMFHI